VPKMAAVTATGDRIFCATWPDAHGPTPNATWPSCARSRATSWAWPTCRPGTCPTPASASRRSATPSATRRSSSTSCRSACWTACSASSRPCSKCASVPKTRRRCGTRACASIASSARPWPGRRAELVGQFYLDLHARSGKRPGAWMDDVRERWLPGSGAADPVAHLVCNFRRGGRPARAAHARRRDHRCSTNSATACTTC
jgi:hypothetical protein